MQTLQQKGFTLIEFMVAILISMVLLAGLYANYMAQHRLQNMQANQTSLMGDLHLVVQIMQSELRQAKAGSMVWTAPNLSYTTIDGKAAAFQYQHIKADRLYWLRPGLTAAQELVRGLDPVAGLTVSQSANVWTITVKANYIDAQGKTASVSSSFKVWPRNL